MLRCPGQDQRFWKPGDIFEVKCRGCGGTVEFFKDEPRLKCRKCGRQVANPKIEAGCAEWCLYAEQCMGIPPEKPVGEIKKDFTSDEKRKDNL
jgi:ribosomal protein S27E